MFQGFKSVDDYHKDMKILIINANVVEDREAIMTRFLNGLNREITNVVKLPYFIEIKDMVHMATEVERQLKRKSCIHQRAILVPFPLGDQIIGERELPQQS